MSREIQGLRWASFCDRPQGIPKSRGRGAKAAGLRYERAFAQNARFAIHGPWLRFEDVHGMGFCQPDFLMRIEGSPCVVEAKLSDVEGARKQLWSLYRPVLESALEESVLCIALVRHLSSLRECTARYDVHDSLRSAILGACAQPTRLSILHWRERTPLGLGGLRPEPPLKKDIGCAKAA